MAETRFVLVATPRTGSTLLGDQLNSHDQVFCDNELFNPHQICRHGFNETAIEGLRYRNAKPQRFWEEFYYSEFAERQKAIGFNFMLGHDHEILARILDDVGLKILFLTRDNKLAQYSSFQIALGSQNWSSVEGARGASEAVSRLRFDFRSFEQWLQGVLTYESLFLRLIDMLGRGCLRLEYRRLLRPETHQILSEYLGVDPFPLRTVLSKQNRNLIADRFENPDDVFDYLGLIGKMHWGAEEI